MPMFLAVTTADDPRCPKGSAILRVELDAPYDGWPGLQTVPDDGRALWTAGTAAPPVPASITNFQARAMLMSMPSPSGPAGRTLFDDVDDALKAEGGLAWQAFEYANDVTRDGDLVAGMGGKLGMTPAQMDQFFIKAAGISA